MIVGIGKLLLAPGSVSLFIITVLVIVVLARRGWRVVAGVVAGGLAIGYLFLSLPVVADRLAAIATRGENWTRQPATHATAAVVVLDGDSPNARVDEGIRLLAAASPPWLIVSGHSESSVLLRQRAVSAGFPKDRVLIEGRGRTTREQARRVEMLLRARQIKSFTLVVSTLHMARALATFRAFGLCPVASPSSPEYEVRTNGWRAFEPQLQALELSRDAVYEYLAWTYYHWHGWLGETPGKTDEAVPCDQAETPGQVS